MAGDSPRAALDAFIGRFQRTVACVADVHVAGEGHELDQSHSVAAHPFRPGPGDRLQLQSRERGQPDLLLDVIHEYTIIHESSGDRRGRRGSYRVQASRYLYEIFDLDGRELLLYHWHPDGLSDVTTPHLHVTCAPRIALPRPRVTEPRRIDVGKAHLPTGHVTLEDVIELLIREFGVEPRFGYRDPADARYWQTVLREHRGARRDSVRAQG